jgi:hypothetical protein
MEWLDDFFQPVDQFCLQATFGEYRVVIVVAQFGGYWRWEVRRGARSVGSGITQKRSHAELEALICLSKEPGLSSDESEAIEKALAPRHMTKAFFG